MSERGVAPVPTKLTPLRLLETGDSHWPVSARTTAEAARAGRAARVVPSSDPRQTWDWSPNDIVVRNMLRAFWEKKLIKIK